MATGFLTPISGSVPDSQSEPRWIIVTPDGKFAYVVNTVSAVISGYQVALTEYFAIGRRRYRRPLPAISNSFLDGALVDDTTAGCIVGVQVQADGALTSLD